MTTKLNLTWLDIESATDSLVLRHRANHFRAVKPVPRGGNVPAAMVAARLHLPLTSHPGPDTLWVDDLVDTGATASRIGVGTFDALFRKDRSPDGYAPNAKTFTDDQWLVFPWEIDTDDEAGPADAVTRLLEYIGEDPTRPGLVDTPRRVLSSLAEMTSGYGVDVSEHMGVVFPDKCDEMVVVHGIDFTSMCEHHMLTFTGTAAVAYIPDGQVVGLSKLARVVDIYAQRLQVQERLTEQIADAIDHHLRPKGVGVVIQAKHSCMGCRGVKKAGATMVTSSLRGAIGRKPEARAEFLSLARVTS